MYESPINKIIGEMKTQMIKDEEGQLMVQVTQAIGYDVDKNELIKALNYDRQQYEKGYADALKVLDEIKAGIEVEIRDCIPAQGYDAWWNGRKDGLEDALEIIDSNIGKEQE